MSTPLLLLHGALGSAAQFDGLVPLLDPHFTVHRLDFEGHGRRAMPKRPFRAEHFVENVLTLLDARGLDPVSMFGYSLGGYVACLLALAHPARVRGIVTLGTKFLWDAEAASREGRMLDPVQIERKVPHFADHLARTHGAANWRDLTLRTADLLRANAEDGGLPPSRIAAVALPVRVIVGDRDRTVSVAECRAIYDALPNGQFEVLPGTGHPFERVPLARLAASLIEFFEEI